MGPAKYLYDKPYCARGEMKNRIKGPQLDHHDDQISCGYCLHHWPICCWNRYAGLRYEIRLWPTPTSVRSALNYSRSVRWLQKIFFELFSSLPVLLKNWKSYRLLPVRRQKKPCSLAQKAHRYNKTDHKSDNPQTNGTTRAIGRLAPDDTPVTMLAQISSGLHNA